MAKGRQWFHCFAEGFAYGMRCHNRCAEAVGYEKRGDLQDCEAEFRIAMKPGQSRALPETPEGRPRDLMETAKAHFHAKVEHPFQIIKCQFGFRKIFYRCIRKNDLKLKRLFALANLWMVRGRLPYPT